MRFVSVCVFPCIGAWEAVYFMMQISKLNLFLDVFQAVLPQMMNPIPGGAGAVNPLAGAVTDVLSGLEHFRGLDYFGGLGLIGSDKPKKLNDVMLLYYQLKSSSPMGGAGAGPDPVLADLQNGLVGSYLGSIAVFSFWIPLLLPPVLWLFLGWWLEKRSNIPRDVRDDKNPRLDVVKEMNKLGWARNRKRAVPVDEAVSQELMRMDRAGDIVDVQGVDKVEGVCCVYMKKLSWESAILVDLLHFGSSQGYR